MTFKPAQVDGESDEHFLHRRLKHRRETVKAKQLDQLYESMESEMGVYSSPEVTGITLNCPGVCDGDPEKSITEAAESLVGRMTDVCKSERKVKSVTIRVEFE